VTVLVGINSVFVLLSFHLPLEQLVADLPAYNIFTTSFVVWFSPRCY